MTNHSKPTRATGTQVRNRVDIIGGIFRHRQIRFPALEGLRPTPSRVRETLFNWLGQTLHERVCLDLFSGSGALGFEAASRGATKVSMVESGKPAFLALKENKRTLDAAACELHFGDAFEFLKANNTKFDVAFLDPPFSSDRLSKVLPLIRSHMAEGGIVYIESKLPLESVLTSEELKSWCVLKKSKAGVVHFGLISIANAAKGIS